MFWYNVYLSLGAKSLVEKHERIAEVIEDLKSRSSASREKNNRQTLLAEGPKTTMNGGSARSVRSKGNAQVRLIVGLL